METLAQIAALLGELKEFLLRRRDRRDRIELFEIRAALKELYFGSGTLRALTLAQGGDISAAVVKFSDTAKPVRVALDRLSEIAGEEGCSIRLQEMLCSLNYQKVTIREQMAFAFFTATEKNDNDWKKIQDEMNEINRLIEELDIIVGGYRLPPK